AWMSSGTWSLLGATADAPLMNAEALAYNFSSYGSADGGVMPWKNIMGLWLVQECRRAWAKAGQDFSYDELIALATDAPPFGPIIVPDAPGFLAPADMPAAITDFCTRTGQTAPQTEGEIVRTALESLALRYRWVLEKLETLLSTRFAALHIVGGGSQNALLNQLTADAIGRPVIAGPVEATALGNILAQAVAMGHLASWDEARAVVRRSTQTQRYAPQPHNREWDAHYAHFRDLLAR
ncbi:MAG: FGGY-family carbohydrate kinase, partial [Anaerolineales bacterium]